MRNPQFTARFNAALQRLTVETYNLRCDFAPLMTLGGRQDAVRKSPLLTQCVLALQGDLLIRLIRIFEDDRDVASFWYLHRCDPIRVGAGADIEHLQHLSKRLKTIRDKTFVHIDRKGLFNPQALYREANISYSEIRENLDALWKIITRLQVETFPDNAPRPRLALTIDGLQEVYQRDIRRTLSR